MKIDTKTGVLKLGCVESQGERKGCKMLQLRYFVQVVDRNNGNTSLRLCKNLLLIVQKKLFKTFSNFSNFFRKNNKTLFLLILNFKH